MDLKEYSDIAPLSGESVQEAIKFLTSNPKGIAEFLGTISDMSKEDSMEKLKKRTAEIITKMQTVKTYDDFQKVITSGYFIPAVLEKSVDEITFSGMENLKTDDSYLYFSNHRDIVLDCTFLDYGLYLHDHQMCEMAFGDNLMSNKGAEYLFRLNGGIVVKRSLPVRQKYMESIRLSKYFVETILERNKSIWVAQKSGRAKDGLDLTSPAIIKMLYLSMRKSKITFPSLIKQCRIVPVSVSYEYDPCDINKSREETFKLLNNGEYNKKKLEDLINLIKGIREYKGRIHIAVGTPLIEKEYKDHEEVAREIDRQIHLNYKLWPTNLFAYDYLEKTDRFADQYKDFDKEKFLSRYSHLKEDVRNYALNAYANPVRSYLAEIEKTN